MLDDIEVEIARPFAEGGRILELGCGTGLILQRLAPLASEAVGIDVSPGMIAKARERGLDVRVGSVTDLDLDDDSFDLVYSFKVLAHVRDIERALSEAVRVTRPGGHLLLELYNPWSLRYLAKRVARPGKISPHRTEAEMYTRWDSPRAVKRMLPFNVDLLGFRGVRVVTPAAYLHRVPALGPLLARAERAAADSPLSYFGGFLIAVLEKHTVAP